MFSEELRQNFPGGAAAFSPAGGTPPQVERLRFFSAGAQRGGKPQSCRLGGGACGVRKSSRRGCVGASPPQRKAPQGVKKARRGVRGTLWNADQNMVFTIIAKESTEGSPLFCFRKNYGGAADFSPAVRQAAKPPIVRRGLRGAEVLPPWLCGQARRREKHRKGLKKPGGACGVRFGTPTKIWFLQ